MLDEIESLVHWVIGSLKGRPGGQRENHNHRGGSMEYQSQWLKARTKKFAIQIIKLSQHLPRTDEARILGKQLLRSGTSVASNYRAACRARSRKEFVSKIGIVVEENDETVFWLEMLSDANILSEDSIKGLLAEANELLAIFGASQRTAKANTRRST